MPDYKNGKIYKIVNDINEKVYIGSTCQTLKVRMENHRSGSKRSNTPVYEEMRKVGIDHFNIVLIELFPCEFKIELEKREYHIMRRYIRQGFELLNSMIEFGKQSDDAKRKMSISGKGKLVSKETRKKLSTAGKGRMFSAEHKRKIGVAHKGKIVREESKCYGDRHGMFKRGSLLRIERLKRSSVWKFSWQENGKSRSKSFAVKKYGEKRAKRLAEKIQNEIYPLKSRS